MTTSYVKKNEGNEQSILRDVYTIEESIPNVRKKESAYHIVEKVRNIRRFATGRAVVDFVSQICFCF